MSLETALNWLSKQQPEIESLLEALVRQNSYTENPAGVNAVVTCLEAELRSIGLKTERVKSPTGRYGDHLAFSNDAPGAPVLLIGHTDTVFPPGNFEKYEVKDGVVYGPGVYDMKGGLVVTLFALRALKQAGLLDRIPVRGVWVADEEVSSPESTVLLMDRARGAACALDFESGRGGDKIVTSRKGLAAVSVHAHGVAAHAGNEHDKGKNAIWALARFIDRAQQLTDYPRGVTVNVGRVEGGTSKNTVPAQARCDIDTRFLAVKDADQLLARLDQAAGANDVEGTSLRVERGAGRPPMERTIAAAALAAEYGKCQMESGLGAGENALVGGGSDAATTAAMGIPSIDGLGPRGAAFHTLNERAELASFIPKAAALVRFLKGRSPNG